MQPQPLLNLAQTIVHGTRLPDHIFEYYWNEKNIDRKIPDRSPTLQELMLVDFDYGIKSIPYVGPLNHEKSHLLSCCLKAAALVVKRTPNLKRLITEASEEAVLTLLATGKVKEVGEHYQRLSELRWLAFIACNKQRQVSEPTIDDYLELERRLRHYVVLNQLEHLASAASQLKSDYTRWDEIITAVVNLKGAAVAGWNPSLNGYITPTRRQRADWRGHYVKAFLEVYQEPAYYWH